MSFREINQKYIEPAAQWTMIFGIIHLPNISYFVGHPDPKGVESLTQTVHWVLAVAMMTLLFLHVAGALKHHLVLKDDALKRMLPGGGA